MEVERKVGRWEGTTHWGATWAVSAIHNNKYVAMSVIDSNFIIIFNIMVGLWHVVHILPWVTLDIQN